MSKYLFAFDISLKCSGLTIFDLITLKPVLVTSIKTNDKETHGLRLYKITQEVKKIINSYKPSIVVIERGFSRFNLSTQAIYKTHGVINCLLRDYEQIYYPPKTIKECILKGNSTKVQVRKRIEEVYPDVVFENEDQSDSFAIGLTYLIKNNIIIWDKPVVKKKVVKKKLNT